MESFFNQFSSLSYFSFSIALNSIIIGTILMVLIFAVKKRQSTSQTRIRYGTWWSLAAVIIILPILIISAPDDLLKFKKPASNKYSAKTLTPVNSVSFVDKNVTLEKQLLDHKKNLKQLNQKKSTLIPLAPPKDISKNYFFPKESLSVMNLIIKFAPIILTLFWILISTFLLLRLVVSFIKIQIIKKTVTILDPESITGLPQRLHNLNIKRKVKIGLTDKVNSPMAAGFYNPIVLIPNNIFREFSDSELVIVILHEMAHLKRFDDYSKLAQKTVEALFFFHPILHWIGRQLDLERELACDEIVINQTGSVNSYAHCLTRLLEFSNSAKNSLVPGFYTSKKQIFKRFEEMFMKNKKNNFFSGKKLIATVSLLVLFSFALVQVAPVLAVPNNHPTYQDLYEVISYDNPTSEDPSLPLTQSDDNEDFLFESDKVSDQNGILIEETVTPTVNTDNPVGTPDFTSRRDRGGIIEGLVDFATDIISGFGHGLTINTDDDGSVTMLWKEDNFTIKMKMEGDVVLTSDDAAIESISEEGYFFISEKRDRNKYELYIEPDRTGELKTIYEVNGDEAEFDDEAERWLAKVLEKVIYRTGLNAEQRVNRIYASKGVDGVLDDMENIESDHVYSIYLKYLLLNDDLSNDNYSRILSLLERNVDSDYNKANTLIEIAPTVQNNHDLIVDYLDVVETIDSDYDKRRVLTELVLDKNSDPEIIMSVLNIINTIDSDYDKATLMIDIADACREDQELSDAYVSALKSIDSDYDTRRVFTALADNTEFSDESLQELIILANDLDSDYEKSNFLIDLADRCDKNRERLYEVIIATEKIASDYEKNRVLSHIEVDCQTETELLLKKLEVLTNMHSDYERTQTLVEHSRCAAENEKVRALYLETIAGISSDFDKTRAISNLIDQSELNQETTLELLNTTRYLSSDYDKKQILKTLAKHCRGNEVLEEAFLDIVDEMHSEYEMKELYYLLNKRAKKYGSMD